MSEYDPLLTMSALNMAIVSLHRITSSGDRLILDREYDSIINNLRMGKIKNSYGKTALMVAAENGHTEAAELLLKHGADVNAKNNDGYTALRLAKRNNRHEVAELLRKHGAKEGLFG